MDINKINEKLKKAYGNRVQVCEDEYSYIVSGELDDYQDILNACSMCTDAKSGKHVVNHIVLKGATDTPIRRPSLKDDVFDGKEVDVLVIGGGISGASILRELSKWNLKLLLVEKDSDLANGASGRNDGQVHPGVDLSKGTIKQSYVRKGNRMYDKVCSDLDVPFRRIGQYAIFDKWWIGPILWFAAMDKKYRCGIEDTKLVGRRALKRLDDSRLNRNAKWALYNPSAGVTSPYELTIAYGENAIQNGAEISLNTIVEDMKVEDGRIKEVHTNRGTIYPRIVVNAAGVFADDIAKMANDEFFSIHPRKGTDFILDKKAKYLINTISSIQGTDLTKKKKTKGGGTMRTVHDNVLCGPNATETREKEDFSTDRRSIDQVYNKQINTVEGMNRRDIITYFSGVRAANFEEDYVLSLGKRTRNIVHCACIQSPGLTTAPAVALDIEKMVVEELKKQMDVTENKDFNPIRKGIPRLNEMNDEERDRLIKENPDYGEIICRCEEISKGEIIDALNSPIKVASIDGIKRRIRPGMGRCQGTFCMPLVAKIIAEHEHIDIKDVPKSSAETRIGTTSRKGGQDNE